MPRSRVTIGLLLGFLGVVAFGGTYPMTRLTVSAIDPLYVTFARPALAGLLALAVLVALRRPVPPRADWPALAIASLCLVWGFPGLTNFAMRLVEANHAGVVAGILPMGTAVAAALILGERQSPRFWAVAAAGMALVLAFSLRSGGGLGPGDALVLLSVAVACTGYVYSARLSRQRRGWEVISWVLVVSLPLALAGLALVTVLTGRAPDWPTVPLPALGGLVYITLVSQYLGFFAWNAGLAMGGIARVGQVQLLQTFITLIFAALLLGERVEPLAWVCAALVVALVFVARRLARH